MKQIIFGLVIVYSSLWLGMYVLHICPRWAELPTLLTIVGACAVGAIFINEGINHEQ